MEMIASKSLLESVGYSVNENKAIKEIFHDSELDWNVLQTPVESSVVDIDNYMINYRSDTKDVLGIVSKNKYQIVDNIEAFKFIDDLPEFEICTVGLANNGKEVFVVGRSNEYTEITKDDCLGQYFNFVHGHDGKRGIQLIISPIRMFCMNQFNLALKKSTFKYAIRHSKDVQSKLSNIKAAIVNNKNYMIQLSNELKDMTMQKATMEIDKFLYYVFPDKDFPTERQLNRRDEIVDTIMWLHKNKDDNQNYRDTNFGYLNAVADFVSHLKPFRNCENTYENKYLDVINNNVILNKAYEVLKAA